MEVYQEYLKNKEGDIFSPITSSDSIYINPRSSQHHKYV